MDYQEILASPHALIEASAGTGKTYTIEQLFVLTIKQGVKVSEVVVITFTDKATAELRERLHLKLLSEQGDEFCRKALEDWSKNSISTIHSFCRRILNDAPFQTKNYLGTSYGDISYGDFVDKFILEQLFQHYANEVYWSEINTFSSLNNFKSDLIKFVEDCHHDDIIEPHFDESLVNAKKLNEFYVQIQEAYLKLLNEVNVEEEFDKWHGTDLKTFKNKCFNNIASYSGVNLSILACQDILADKIVDNFPSKRYKKKGNFSYDDIDERLKNFISLLQKAKKIWQDLRLASKLKIYRVALGYVSEQKKISRQYNFDDLIIKVQQSLTTFSNKEEIIKLLQKKYRLFIIDEFQDTNVRQWQIFKTLAMTGENPGKLIVVGDPKQSIYRFRGADLDAYLQAGRDIEERGGTIFSLVTNWRSFPGLVQSYNKIFSHRGWFRGSLAYKNVECPNLEDRKVRLYQDDSQDKPITLWQSDWKEEELATKMADKCQEIVIDKQILVRLKDGSQRYIDYKDICFLVSSKKKAKELAVVFERREIPFFLYQENNIFSSREALNLSIALRYLADSKNRNSQNLLLTSDFFGYAPYQLEQEDFIISCEITVLFQKWKLLVSQQKWSDLFDSLFYQTNYRTRNNTNIERVLSNYRQLVEEILSISYGKKVVDISLWFEEIRLEKKKFHKERDYFRQNAAKNQVTIMTIHSSKGLEFPIVFLYAFFAPVYNNKKIAMASNFSTEKEKYVHSFSDELLVKEKEKLLEELARLYYVAITRTIFKIYMAIKLNSKGAEERLAEILIDVDSHFPDTRCDEGAVNHKEEGDVTLPLVDINEKITLPSYKHRFEYTNSFSSLSRMISAPHKFYIKSDEGNDDRERVREAGFYGVKAGLALHQILEEIDYNEVFLFSSWQSFYEKEKLLLERILLVHNFNPSHQTETGLTYAEEACCFCWSALTKKLEGIGLALGQIKKQDYLNELGFFAQAGLVKALQKVPKVNLNDSYLQGFIDLIFRVDGVYYLLDWKSNYLPSYDLDSLKKSIADHRYHLQYELYSIALCAWLEKFANPSINFGGTFYIYLRGLAKDEGIYFDKYLGNDLQFERHKYMYLNDYD